MTIRIIFGRFVSVSVGGDTTRESLGDAVFMIGSGRFDAGGSELERVLTRLFSGGCDGEVLALTSPRSVVMSCFFAIGVAAFGIVTGVVFAGTLFGGP